MDRTEAERLAVLETTMKFHVEHCEARAARAEKWLRAAAIGIILLVLEAILRFFIH